jgi:hypothetical protein
MLFLSRSNEVIMCLLPDGSQIYISGQLYISGFSVYSMSRNACKITNGFNYFPIGAVS